MFPHLLLSYLLPSTAFPPTALPPSPISHLPPSPTIPNLPPSPIPPRSRIIERAYKIKSILRLFAATFFIYWAVRTILRGLFKFEFFCDLTDNPASSLQAIPTPLHFCVNLNAPLYYLLIVGFVIVSAVNWAAAVVAILAAFKLFLDKRSLPLSGRRKMRMFKIGFKCF